VHIKLGFRKSPLRPRWNYKTANRTEQHGTVYSPCVGRIMQKSKL